MPFGKRKSRTTRYLGKNFGWRSHPGPVVVLMNSGELTFYEADDSTCAGGTYVAGQVFVDSGQGYVHFPRNLSTTANLELWATYFDVPPGMPQRTTCRTRATARFVDE